MAVNKNAASTGVSVPTVLLTTTSADADPSLGETTESTWATGEDAVLPNAANGAALKNSPWFIRVRSQPATLAGEAGNNLNPGFVSVPLNELQSLN